MRLGHPAPHVAGTLRGEHKLGHLTFCDFSSFYSPTGGGIRTYHDAKLAWFSSQHRHRYCLIYPGRHRSVKRLTPQVTVVTAYGPHVRSGYRVPIDWRWVRGAVRELQPEVLETGDPWLSGPLALWYRRTGDVRGRVSSFFHCDPVHTYLAPWAARSDSSRPLRTRLADGAGRCFYRAQQQYDVTLASSAGVERGLRRHGVHNILRVPFGVDPRFLAVGRARAGQEGRASPGLLYAGRLQTEKGFDVVLRAMPELLRRTAATITIVGTGPLAEQTAHIRDRRVRVLGYVADRDQLAEIYAAHSVLLAPGPHETFGIGVLEGLAAGLTVVGPNEGGTGELLSQLPDPCFFQAGDPASLVRAVECAIDGDWHGRAEAAQAVADHHGTWNDAVQRQVNQYCEYLSLSMT